MPHLLHIAELPQAAWHPDSLPQTGWLEFLSCCDLTVLGRAQSVGICLDWRVTSGHGVYQSSRQSACLGHFPAIRATALGCYQTYMVITWKALEMAGYQVQRKMLSEVWNLFALIQGTEEKSYWRTEYSWPVCPIKLEFVLLHLSGSSPIQLDLSQVLLLIALHLQTGWYRQAQGSAVLVLFSISLSSFLTSFSFKSLPKNWWLPELSPVFWSAVFNCLLNSSRSHSTCLHRTPNLPPAYLLHLFPSLASFFLWLSQKHWSHSWFLTFFTYPVS